MKGRKWHRTEDRGQSARREPMGSARGARQTATSVVSVRRFYGGREREERLVGFSNSSGLEEPRTGDRTIDATPTMREGEVEKLRAVVRDCLGKHLYSSAIFFADKLATLAGNATQDLYMQASGQPSPLCGSVS